jgi:arylsulfatase A-like enzyme
VEERTSRRAFLQTGVEVAGAALLGHMGASAASAAAPPAAAARARPNVLLLIVDTLRADYLGCHGADVATPNIDRLAREGVRFRHAHSEALPTGPARRSIHLGRRIFPFRGWSPPPGLNQGPGWRPIGADEPTLFTTLERAGYWTGYVTDNPFLAFNDTFAPFRKTFDRFQKVGGQIGSLHPRSSVSDAQLARWTPAWMTNPDRKAGVRRYLADNGRGVDASQTAAMRVCGLGVDALEEAVRSRRPFALAIDSFDPHEPWVPPMRYVRPYLPAGHRGPVPADARYGGSDYLDAAALEAMRAVYKGMVTLVDEALGRVLGRLRELGVADETAVVLVSDHGFLLGEHKLTGKIATSLHAEMTHVPLIVRTPDRAGAGRTSDWFASTHDVAATLLALAGVRRPGAMDGVDLSATARGRPLPRREVAYGGFANSFYLRTREWVYLGRNDGTSRRLFHLTSDPAATRDVAAEHPDVVARLHRKLLDLADGSLPFYGDYIERKRRIRQRAGARRR